MNCELTCAMCFCPFRALFVFHRFTQGVAAVLCAFALSGRCLFYIVTQGVAAVLCAFALSGRYLFFIVLHRALPLCFVLLPFQGAVCFSSFYTGRCRCALCFCPFRALFVLHRFTQGAAAVLCAFALSGRYLFFIVLHRALPLCFVLMPLQGVVFFHRFTQGAAAVLCSFALSGRYLFFIVLQSYCS